jgi:ribosome biogenesis protein ENP2
LAYSYPTCDLLVCGASNDIWRLNLEQGTFLSPLPTDMPGVNVCEINAAHQLWGFGGDDGTVEFWHPTTRKRIAKIDVAGALARMPEFSKSDAAKASVTALKFADDGLNFAVGLSTGQVMLYDLRRPTPTMIKDHQYGFPIKNIEYHDSGNVISADTKIVKIWDKNHVWHSFFNSLGQNLHVYRAAT